VSIKSFEDLSDAEVLDAVGPLGPAFAGAYLYERAEWIRAKNPGGVLGPGMFDAADRYVPSNAACADLAERGMLVAVDFVIAEPVEEPEAEPVEEPVGEAVVKRGPGRPRKVIA
jgi:hypothetical protein